jgi:hypothetical protein
MSTGSLDFGFDEGWFRGARKGQIGLVRMILVLTDFGVCPRVEHLCFILSALWKKKVEKKSSIHRLASMSLGHGLGCRVRGSQSIGRIQLVAAALG